MLSAQITTTFISVPFTDMLLLPLRRFLRLGCKLVMRGDAAVEGSEGVRGGESAREAAAAVSETHQETGQYPAGARREGRYRRCSGLPGH